MGVVDDAGGDDYPKLNAESNRRTHDIAAGALTESNSLKDLIINNNNNNHPPSPPTENHRVSLDRGLQKGGSGGGPILRPHRDPLDKDEGGVQGRSVGEAIVAQQSNGGSVANGRNEEIEGKAFKREIGELEELLSKLNPMAEEFVPPVLARSGSVGGGSATAGGLYTNNIMSHHFMDNGSGSVNGNANGGFRRKRNNYGQGKRINNRTSMAQREEIIRRTVYVSDIDQQITEEHLAALFINCGQVVDCRICGDPNSVLRFAFIEFTDEEGARAALSLAGTMLGYYPVRVLPSKTAIAPVNPTFLPRSEDEREMCARTIYCTNIDRRVTQADVKLFFESVCGEVYRLRLLGDYNHPTRIAFVEFVLAQSAIAALNCSGVVLGSLPIRISPSKTPVRPRAPRQPMH